jgi:hypothetical protein
MQGMWLGRTAAVRYTMMQRASGVVYNCDEMSRDETRGLLYSTTYQDP